MKVLYTHPGQKLLTEEAGNHRESKVQIPTKVLRDG